MKASRIAIFAIMLLVSCRPASYEQFIRADQAPDGEYAFALDLADSAATYDLSFYTRIDPALMAAEQPSGSLGLQVSWFPPAVAAPPAGTDPVTLDTAAIAETVYIPYGGKAGSVQLYRSGIKPSPAGEWRLTITPMTPPAGLRGLGIICKRND